MTSYKTIGVYHGGRTNRQNGMIATSCNEMCLASCDPHPANQFHQLFHLLVDTATTVIIFVIARYMQVHRRTKNAPFLSI